MNCSKPVRALLALLSLSGGLLSFQVQASPMVTYTWTTTGVGYGPHVSQPSSATFDVPLSDVQGGVIPQSDITNIQLFYPGLTFNSADASSDGFDFSAFVNPLTGSFIYSDAGQGLGVIAFAGTDINNATTFLSMTIDNPVSGSVADEFNALNNGAPFAGYPTSGYWTASFPSTDGNGVPEPGMLVLIALGLFALVIARMKSNQH